MVTKKDYQLRVFGFGLLLIVHFAMVVRFWTQIEERVSVLREVQTDRKITVEAILDDNKSYSQRLIKAETEIKALFACCLRTKKAWQNGIN